MRRKFIAGNWKMHKTSKEALSYIKEFKNLVKNVIDTDIVLGVPFTLLNLLNDECKNTNIKLAAQNLFYEEQGAYTGEISPLMVKEFAQYVIIGHSERRKYFNETDEIINKKIKIAIKHNLQVIFCVGETQEQRDSDETNKIISSQLKLGLLGINNINEIIIAYEPIWAIGTGKTATPSQANEIHKFIRKTIKSLYNEKSAQKLRLIYGGSVNPDNANSILQMSDIDGCLPGGASLDPIIFEKIIRA